MIRMIVASNDGGRVLARPGALAGWALPAVAVTGPRATVEDWTDDDVARAAAVVGGPVRPRAALEDQVWEFVADGRITAAGRTWIPAVDADRFGSDARSVRRWARRRSDPSADGPPYR